MFKELYGFTELTGLCLLRLWYMVIVWMKKIAGYIVFAILFAMEKIIFFLYYIVKVMKNALNIFLTYELSQNLI